MSGRRETRGFWEKNWGWLVGCGCILPIFVIAGLVTFGLWSAKRALSSHDAIRQAVERLENDTRALQALGTPIETHFLRENTSIRFNGKSGGTMEARFGVAGPDGAGSLSIRAHKNGDAWVLDALRLRIDESDEEIDLLSSPGGEANGVSGGQAPRWSDPSLWLTNGAWPPIFAFNSWQPPRELARPLAEQRVRSG